MKLTQIRHLLAVAERGNLQSSAKDLGVSQTALTRSLQALERELGASLFKRDDKAMVLTSAGELFVRRAAAAQLELDRARDDVRRKLDTPTGLVSIGLSASPHASILPKVLTPFQHRFRDVRLRIVEGAFPKVEREVRDGALDFYVGPIWPHHRAGGLKVEKLYDVARIVVARAGHPLAGATSFSELAQARWISTSRLELDPLFEQHRLGKPDIVVEVQTGLSMLSAVAASDALLILSASWLPLITRTGVLTCLRLKERLEAPAISIVARTKLPLTYAAGCLHDLFIQAARDMQMES